MGGSATNEGMTRYHTWGLVVPLLAATAGPVLTSKYVIIDGAHPAANAVLAGAVVAAVAWLLMTTIDTLKETHAVSKAVLCGLLVAEIMVLRPFKAVPPMATITLWLFFYFSTMEST